MSRADVLVNAEWAEERLGQPGTARNVKSLKRILEKFA